MQLQVTQENLNKALGTVARVANARGTLPVLANVLIKTVNNRLSIAATNLDIAITHYIGAKVSDEGAITVPARLMQDFVSSLPGGVIDLKLDEYRLHIATDQYQSTINGVSAEEFPVMPAISNGKTLKVAGPVLKKGLQRVVIAASNDEARPILTGILLHTFEGNLYMAATDSYRLAEERLMPSNEDVHLLVPVSAMQDLLRILGDFEGDVVVTSDEQQVLFQVGDIELVARLIEGKYPDYRKLIPTTFATSVTLKRADLVNITKVSSLFARESAGSITINIDEEKQEVSIRSIASQLGENTATATGKVTGSGSITLNSRYLLDALHVLNGEDVVFSFNGKLEPSVLADPAADDYVHIVMPLKS
ncbi:MAG TPA: DNA polymerase III subunit beta [Candidatus Saccharimonadales bacterium]|jgi:DNA polymerase-3 subunit beta|nr:DNA polymerase III subunit beta [Candidatus Saccharimonadales bacterium]